MPSTTFTLELNDNREYATSLISTTIDFQSDCASSIYSAYTPNSVSTTSYQTNGVTLTATITLQSGCTCSSGTIGMKIDGATVDNTYTWITLSESLNSAGDEITISANIILENDPNYANLASSLPIALTYTFPDGP
jgi:hypothetical protein